MHMEQLTERQAQILDFVAGYLKRRKMPPTRAEIADAFSFSHQTASQHLEALRKKGRIDWIDGSPRTIRIIE